MYSNFIELVDAKKRRGRPWSWSGMNRFCFLIVKAFKDRLSIIRFLIATNAFLFAVRLLIPARLTRLKAVGIP